MKTLSEEINEIKNAKISKTAKRTALARIDGGGRYHNRRIEIRLSAWRRCADVRQVV